MFQHSLDKFRLRLFWREIIIFPYSWQVVSCYTTGSLLCIKCLECTSNSDKLLHLLACQVLTWWNMSSKSSLSLVVIVAVKWPDLDHVSYLICCLNLHYNLPPVIFGSSDLLFLHSVAVQLQSWWIFEEAGFSKVATKCVPLHSNGVISKG